MDLELLAEANRRLSGPLDLSAVLGRASSFIVPDLADWYVLALTQADGHMRALAYEHRDPERRTILAALVATSVFDDPTDSAMARAARGTLGWAPRFAIQPWNSAGVVCGWSEPFPDCQGLVPLRQEAEGLTDRLCSAAFERGLDSGERAAFAALVGAAHARVTGG